MENRAHNAFKAGKALLLAALFNCAPAHAQEPLADVVNSVGTLLTPGGDGAAGADVFGITDLISTDADAAEPTLSPNNACEGFQCGETTLFELPGLENEDLSLIHI